MEGGEKVSPNPNNSYPQDLSLPLILTGEKMISKNFMWWLVCVIFLIAVVLNVIVNHFLMALIMGLVGLFAFKQYYKYRVLGQ